MPAALPEHNTTRTKQQREKQKLWTSNSKHWALFSNFVESIEEFLLNTSRENLKYNEFRKDKTTWLIQSQ